MIENIFIYVLGMLFVLAIVLLPVILWIAMFVHAIMRNIADKALWILILIIGGPIGGIAYYFAVYRKSRKGA